MTCTADQRNSEARPTAAGDSRLPLERQARHTALRLDPQQRERQGQPGHSGRANLQEWRQQHREEAVLGANVNQEGSPSQHLGHRRADGLKVNRPIVVTSMDLRKRKQPETGECEQDAEHAEAQQQSSEREASSPGWGWTQDRPNGSAKPAKDVP